MSTGPAAGTEPAVLRAGDGEALWSVGALLLVKADGERTDGAYTLVDHTAPAGYETPYHCHHREDELCYVLDGELDCLYGADGENEIRVGQHDTVALPRGVPHGFRVAGEAPCRMLVCVAPAGLEEFFREVGRPAVRLTTPPPGSMDPAALAEAAADYDLEILGPLPA